MGSIDFHVVCAALMYRENVIFIRHPGHELCQWSFHCKVSMEVESFDIDTANIVISALAVFHLFAF